MAGEQIERPAKQDRWRNRFQDGDFKQVVNRLLEEVNREGESRCRAAAHIFERVKHRMSYDHDVESGFTRSPGDTWNEKSGNCADQTGLLGTLYLEANLDYRVIHVEKPENSHVFVELYFPGTTSTISRDLQRFYKNNGFEGGLEIRYLDADTEKGSWWICDATMSEYIGDMYGLMNQGYWVKTPRGMQWQGKHEVQFDSRLL
jgi:hypothetical protein